MIRVIIEDVEGPWGHESSWRVVFKKTGICQVRGIQSLGRKMGHDMALTRYTSTQGSIPDVLFSSLLTFVVS